jgi:hypothetical protein
MQSGQLTDGLCAVHAGNVRTRPGKNFSNRY